MTYAYVPRDTDFTAPNATSTLSVGSKPKVTVQPKSQTVNAGATVTFTAAATGTSPITLQWQVSTNGGKTYTNIAGPVLKGIHSVVTCYSLSEASAARAVPYSIRPVSRRKRSARVRAVRPAL